VGGHHALRGPVGGGVQRRHVRHGLHPRHLRRHHGSVPGVHFQHLRHPRPEVPLFRLPSFHGAFQIPQIRRRGCAPVRRGQDADDGCHPHPGAPLPGRRPERDRPIDRRFLLDLPAEKTRRDRNGIRTGPIGLPRRHTNAMAPGRRGEGDDRK